MVMIHKQQRRVFALQALAAAAILALAGCADNEAKSTDHEAHHERVADVTLPRASREEIGLRTAAAEARNFSGTMTIPASVMADQDREAVVGALVAGRVARVMVRAGERVKAGQVLMEVEGLEIGEIKAAFLSAKATLEFQKANLNRQRQLAREQIGSQRALLEAEAEYEKALAEFNAEDKKIHSIGLGDADVSNPKNGAADEHRAGTLPVKSPIAGIVAERNVVIGQSVDAATNAFRIINTASVWVSGQIHEKDIRTLAERSEASFAAASYPEEQFRGRVTLIGQVIDEKSRTITVRAEFANPSGRLKPNMFGELRVPRGASSRAILVPSDAVVKIDQAACVFIAKNDSVFECRKIETGITEGGMVEIRSGVKEGEHVVAKGAFSLKSELLKSELEEEEH